MTNDNKKGAEVLMWVRTEARILGAGEGCSVYRVSNARWRRCRRDGGGWLSGHVLS